jgi:sigma-B regulation protein RsbU (phosphoserine phosphatase)
LARYTIRAAAVRKQDPSHALNTLNQVLLQNRSERFCTVGVLRLRHQAGVWSATISSGGHPLPYLIARDARPMTIGRPGSLVGVLNAPTFFDITTELGPGDSVVLYTDGITEGRNTEHGFYGERRLARSLAHHRGSASSLTEGLLHEVLQFQSQRPRDDIAVVTVCVPLR